MVYAVGKKESFCIYDKLIEFLRITVSLVIFKDILNSMTYGQVPLAVLVPMDVTSPLGSFGQMVCILFLLQGQLLPSGNLVTHHLKVGKLIKQILEITLFLSAAGCYGQHTSHHHNLYN